MAGNDVGLETPLTSASGLSSFTLSLRVCSCSFFTDAAAENAAVLALTSGTDPEEEMETSERTGLESPDLEPRKDNDFCRGAELRRSNMTPAIGDKLGESLQPAKRGSPLSNQNGSKEIFPFGEFFKACKVSHRRLSEGIAKHKKNYN